MDGLWEGTGNAISQKHRRTPWMCFMCPVSMTSPNRVTAPAVPTCRRCTPLHEELLPAEAGRDASCYCLPCTGALQPLWALLHWHELPLQPPSNRIWAAEGTRAHWIAFSLHLVMPKFGFIRALRRIEVAMLCLCYVCRPVHCAAPETVQD